jgi:hypothetical protein
MRYCFHNHYFKWWCILLYLALYVRLSWKQNWIVFYLDILTHFREKTWHFQSCFLLGYNFISVVNWRYIPISKEKTRNHFLFWNVFLDEHNKHIFASFSLLSICAIFYTFLPVLSEDLSWTIIYLNELDINKYMNN